MKGYSILICCYNSEKRIIQTLTALLEMKKENIGAEIIIIDNCSTDSTSKVAEEFMKNKSFRYSIHSEELPGKTNAIIKGINVALFDKIVFCDDDVLLATDFLQEAEKIFLQDDRIGMVGSKGFVSDELIIPDWFQNFDIAYAVGEQWLTNGDVTLEKGYVWGAGSILRKEAWNKILEKGFKRFYTGFVGSNKEMSGEDTELCLWVIFAGFKIWYSDNLTYIHNLNQNRLNWKYLLKMNVGFARSQVYLDLIQTTMEFKSIDFFQYKKAKMKELRTELFLHFFSANYFKSLWISYIEKRPGYVITFKRNNNILRIKELIFCRKELLRISKELELAVCK